MVTQVTSVLLGITGLLSDTKRLPKWRLYCWESQACWVIPNGYPSDVCTVRNHRLVERYQTVTQVTSVLSGIIGLLSDTKRLPKCVCTVGNHRLVERYQTVSTVRNHRLVERYQTVTQVTFVLLGITGLLSDTKWLPKWCLYCWESQAYWAIPNGYPGDVCTVRNHWLVERYQTVTQVTSVLLGITGLLCDTKRLPKWHLYCWESQACWAIPNSYPSDVYTVGNHRLVERYQTVTKWRLYCWESQACWAIPNGYASDRILHLTTIMVSFSNIPFFRQLFVCLKLCFDFYQFDSQPRNWFSTNLLIFRSPRLV